MPSPFLPFTPNGKATECAAIAVKRHLGLQSDAAVDPYDVLPDVPARLIDVSAFDPALLLDHAQDWSGIGFGCIGPDGEELIGLNPTHSAKRQRVTLMEEIVHIVLDHPKSALTVCSAGVTVGSLIGAVSSALTKSRPVRASSRSYSSAVEDDAFNIGAACIIPYRRLFDSVHTRREHATTIAAQFNVSDDFVVYRIKRAGLSKIYRKHHG